MLESILNFFAALINKMSLVIFSIVVFCVSTILLFFPRVYIDLLYIYELPSNWRIFIYICFLVSFFYLILAIPISIFKYLKRKKKTPYYLAIHYLRNEMTSDVNKFIVSTFYDNEEKKFASVSEASLSSGYVDFLKKKYIVTNASQFFDYDGQYSAISLNSKIVKYLNSKLRWRRLKIKNGKIVFKIFS